MLTTFQLWNRYEQWLHMRNDMNQSRWNTYSMYFEYKRNLKIVFYNVIRICVFIIQIHIWSIFKILLFRLCWFHTIRFIDIQKKSKWFENEKKKWMTIYVIHTFFLCWTMRFVVEFCSKIFVALHLSTNENKLRMRLKQIEHMITRLEIVTSYWNATRMILILCRKHDI